jgi:aminoglycoside 6'-N-acetyltransferase
MLFRLMRENDLPLVATWLAEQHVQRWWRDSSAPLKVEEKYLPRIAGVEPTEMFVILHDDEPIGFIQRYLMRHHPDWARSLAPSGLVFDEAAGIDYAIGRPEMVGRGIGSAVVAAFSQALLEAFQDVTDIVVTPQAANAASCRVLEKAGYERRWTGLLDSDDPGDAGLAAMYVLTRAPHRVRDRPRRRI